jgi:hypothetical protein
LLKASSKRVACSKIGKTITTLKLKYYYFNNLCWNNKINIRIKKNYFSKNQINTCISALLALSSSTTSWAFILSSVLPSKSVSTFEWEFDDI